MTVEIGRIFAGKAEDVPTRPSTYRTDYQPLLRTYQDLVSIFNNPRVRLGSLCSSLVPRFDYHAGLEQHLPSPLRGFHCHRMPAEASLAQLSGLASLEDVTLSDSGSALQPGDAAALGSLTALQCLSLAGYRLASEMNLLDLRALTSLTCFRAEIVERNKFLNVSSPLSDLQPLRLPLTPRPLEVEISFRVQPHAEPLSLDIFGPLNIASLSMGFSLQDAAISV